VQAVFGSGLSDAYVAEDSPSRPPTPPSLSVSKAARLPNWRQHQGRGNGGVLGRGGVVMGACVWGVGVLCVDSIETLQVWSGTCRMNIRVCWSSV
jgi:hypothetical protein